MLLLPRLLKRAVRRGTLVLYGQDGTRHEFGPGGEGAPVVIRMKDASIERAIFLNPELAFAEAYMDGKLDFEEGSTVLDLLTLFWGQRRALRSHPIQQVLRKARFLYRGFQMHNPVGVASKKVQHHYDIPTAFYRLWLDETMTYSCAYWSTPEEGLEAAQRAKLRHVAAKLKLEPGMTVLDIGSGWGELAIYLAKATGAQVVGLNVSTEQCAAARERAAAAGVADRVTFLEEDYRLHKGSYDRITSVGMMEHVGVRHYGDYFGAIRDLLKQNGMAMVHCIGRSGPPGFTGPFFEKYIFPGGYAPALSEVFKAVETSGLWASDVEFLRMHYHWTIKAWRERFMARRDEVVAMLGERFARMWEFYLAAVEVSFQHGQEQVFQMMLGHHKTAVPVIRDYVTDDERALAARGY